MEKEAKTRVIYLFFNQVKHVYAKNIFTPWFLWRSRDEVFVAERDEGDIFRSRPRRIKPETSELLRKH